MIKLFIKYKNKIFINFQFLMNVKNNIVPRMNCYHTSSILNGSIPFAIKAGGVPYIILGGPQIKNLSVSLLTFPLKNLAVNLSFVTGIL